jgi:polysaccharide export outer membrane protein
MAWTARLLLIASLGCGGVQTVPSDLQLAPPSSAGLGAGDVFEVRVFGEEQLSAQYRVEQDGTIDFPFLGRLSVEGREPRDVAAEIARGLREREILVEPQVTVFIAESNSLRVSVMGAVARPGTFPVTPGMTVVEAISNAGGFTALASQNETVLTRRTDTGVRRFTVPARRISDGRETDVPLQGGDIIFVPERAF